MNITAAFSRLDQFTDPLASGDVRVNVAILLLLGFSFVVAYWYIKFLTGRGG